MNGKDWRGIAMYVGSGAYLASTLIVLAYPGIVRPVSIVGAGGIALAVVALVWQTAASARRRNLRLNLRASKTVTADQLRTSIHRGYRTGQAAATYTQPAGTYTSTTMYFGSGGSSGGAGGATTFGNADSIRRADDDPDDGESGVPARV